MSSKMRVDVGESYSDVLVGITGFERAAVVEKPPAVAGSSENVAVHAMVVGSTTEDVVLVKGNGAKANKGVIDETSSKQPVAEKKVCWLRPLARLCS
ncbi:hypothetical protein SESBI_04071 [Sesbania bispinosa]|nr:hypothetical protein SESBI_04071 [Sesbania bispinosa]